MNKDIKMSNCPFCGFEYPNIETDHIDTHSQKYRVHCPCCGAYGPDNDRLFLAVLQWNNATIGLRMPSNNDKYFKALETIDWIQHHKCSCCECPIGYEKIDNKWYFNSQCDCTPYGSRLPVEVPVKEVYDFAVKIGKIKP